MLQDVGHSDHARRKYDLGPEELGDHSQAEKAVGQPLELVLEQALELELELELEQARV